jgi:hypothetical protein
VQSLLKRVKILLKAWVLSGHEPTPFEPPPANMLAALQGQSMHFNLHWFAQRDRREKFIKLLMSYGLHETHNSLSMAEQQDKWRYFYAEASSLLKTTTLSRPSAALAPLSNSVNNVVVTPQQWYVEASSLLRAARKLVHAQKAPASAAPAASVESAKVDTTTSMPVKKEGQDDGGQVMTQARHHKETTPVNGPSLMGGHLNDWDFYISPSQAEALLRRMDIFDMLRSDVLVLRPADLQAKMMQVTASPEYQRAIDRPPTWWKSPDCDILLMQVCYS